MVHRPALIHKLNKKGLKGNLAFYLYNFLTGIRQFRVKCRSIFSTPQQLENGLPQGSCLSPLLFNIFINDLFDNIPQHISYSLFADDSAIWCSDKNLDESIFRLQTALGKLEQWSGVNGLQFSAEKSAAIIFSRSTRIQTDRRQRAYITTPYHLLTSSNFWESCWTGGCLCNNTLNTSKQNAAQGSTCYGA